jgi:nickel/cobalt transporter (NicO) family protein
MQKVMMLLRQLIITGCIVASMLLGATGVSLAQALEPANPPVSAEKPTPQNPFARPELAPATPSSPGAAERGFFDRAWAWLLQTQSDLNRRMAQAVKGLSGDDPVTAGFMLIAIAFGYGVLHAAGPGHGKAIIASYVLANEETVRRGIILSFISAIFQALSAILFVGIMALILQQTSMAMRQTEATIETVSWGLVALVGAVLLWRQIKPLLATSTAGATATSPAASHDHHVHGPDCGCGHSHMPAPEQLQGAWSWRQALPVALSVGIRPCSGAILLLIFALSQGMLWAGIVGTFAMALGTAITVSILAAMAVKSKTWAMQASGPGSIWANRIHTAAGFAGALLIFGLGTAFFVASLANPASPL